MNSLNGTRPNMGVPPDLRERTHSEHTESFPRPRPRKPLSKFTTTSSHNPSSSNFTSSPSRLVPAYRTYANESLPIVSTENQQKLNIPPFAKPPPESSSSCGTTRQLLLQRKSIHRSLEDLRTTCSSQNGRRRSMDSNISCKNTQYYYMEQGNSTDCLQASQGQGSFDTIQDSGGSGDNTWNISLDGSENLTNLSIENETLKKMIAEEKRKSVIYKIINAFAFEALRKRSKMVIESGELLEKRREECAARVVLHHLLLNSWRMTKGQVTAVALENTQMHKTIDNQSLQLNIVRKMQSMEKDKMTAILKEYTDVKRDYYVTMKENEAIKEEYAKVLEEKRTLESHLRGLTDVSSRLNIDLQIQLDKKEMQLRSMELDRLRADKFSRENEALANEAELVKSKIKELSAQQSHWQEKAMEYESKCYELKLDMEEREKAYEKLLLEKMDVKKENEILTLSNSKLEKAVAEKSAKLTESTVQRSQLEKSYTECKEELEYLEDQMQYLQGALRQYKKENQEIRQKLFDCTLKNVQKRRVWGAALYFLVSPIEAFKRLYFGVPNNPPHEKDKSPVKKRSEMLDAQSQEKSRTLPILTK